MPVIFMYCTACRQGRYKSNKDFGPKDIPTAKDFDPIPPQEPGSDDAPPVCVECGGMLKPITQENLMRLAAPREAAAEIPDREQIIRMRQMAEVRPPESAPVSGPGVETLFAAGAGEDIKDMRDTPEGVVIITNRRIVRVRI